MSIFSPTCLATDDGKNDSPQNNIRIKDILEAPTGCNFLTTVTALSNILLDQGLATEIEID